MLRDESAFSESVHSRLLAMTDSLPVELRALVQGLASRPGKGIRHRVMFACAELGAPAPHRLAQVGAVVEAIHLASLMHDDVIDRSSVRRGLATAQVTAGVELALLAGLACIAAAGEAAADLGIQLPVSESFAELTYGEMLDVERAFDVGYLPEDYTELVRRKTGELFRLSCVLGATEAGLSAEIVEGLASFGMEFGVAFQVRDDCLDLDLVQQQKPAGSDLLLGLFGAPVLHALRMDGGGDLARMLLDPELGAGDLPRIAHRVDASGGLRIAREAADQVYADAVSSVSWIPGVTRVTALTDDLWRSLP
ncbi:polyprenyl synthetase family protein [Kribbella sp. NBC_01505]|uniref:polyprenyl synthetase family protein n=1 Tax=Kribbella sp. NBC_01505 TaxID=2903580 RepID=UPI00386D13A2